MRCPSCNGATRVVETRESTNSRRSDIAADRPYVRRRRRCRSCVWHGVSYELILGPLEAVVLKRASQIGGARDGGISIQQLH